MSDRSCALCSDVYRILDIHKKKMLFKVGVNVLNNKKMHTRTLYKCKPLFRRSNSIKNKPPYKYFLRFIFV